MILTRSVGYTLLLSAAWAACLILIWFPGAMSTDSFAILAQARSGEYIDAWPPMLAAIWGPLDAVWRGPQPLLALQLVFYFGGAALVIALAFRLDAWISTIAFACFALYPPLLSIIGVIWIDILMAAFFMMSTALAYLALVRRPPSLSVLALSILCLFVAVSMRHNAAAAATPIAILIVAAMHRNWPFELRSLSAIIGAGATLTVCLFFMSSLASSKMADTKGYFWTTLLQYDLAGIAVRTPPGEFNGAIFEPQKLEDVETLYTPRSILPLRLGHQVHQAEMGQAAENAEPLSNRFSGSASARRELVQTWLSSIAKHPIAYLSHRAAVFSSLIGLPPYQSLWGPVYSRIDANELGISQRGELWGHPYFDALWWLSSTLIFSPSVYLAASFVLFAFALLMAYRTKDIRFVLASLICMSGLLHMAGLFFVSLSADFRYSHWMITTTVLAFVLTSATILERTARYK